MTIKHIHRYVTVKISYPLQRIMKCNCGDEVTFNGYMAQDKFTDEQLNEEIKNKQHQTIIVSVSK